MLELQANAKKYDNKNQKCGKRSIQLFPYISRLSKLPDYFTLVATTL